MSDIVEELRGHARWNEKYTSFEAKLFTDAAAEIERLRAALRAIADNSLADSPIWVARDGICDYTFADNLNAPTWVRWCQVQKQQG